MKLVCDIYKSPKKDEMYLFVDKSEGLKRVPEELLVQFGTPQQVMTKLVTPETRLARVKAQDVIDNIKEQGFLLQMPPPKDEYMLDLYKAPTDARY